MLRNAKWRAPALSIAVALAFFYYCSEPWNFFPNQRAQVAIPASEPVGKTVLPAAQGDVRASVRAIDRLTRALEETSPESEDANALLDGIEEHLGSIQSTDAKTRAWFEEVGTRIRTAGLSTEILDRHERVVESYDSEYEEVQAAVDRVRELRNEFSQAASGGGETAAAAAHQALLAGLQELDTELEEMVGEEPHMPVDPHDLPHRIAEPVERLPRLSPEEFTELRKPIQLAYVGDPRPFLLAQADSQIPTDDDLSETIDVQITQEIQDLALSLGGDPLSIFNWVRQEVRFVPSFGSIQGSEGCRVSLECNAHDTASLLIALLRAAGTPARYALGTLDVPADLFRSAIGDFEDLSAAARMAASGGIPVAIVRDINGNRIAVRMEHVWVEAYVDYTPSRAARNLDPDSWVPLDATLKRTRFQPPLDLAADAGVDFLGLREDLLAGAVVNTEDPFVTSLPEQLANERIATFQESLENLLAAELSDVPVPEVIGRITNEAKPLGILPGSLPGVPVVIGGTTHELDSSARHRLSIEILDEPGLSKQLQFDTSFPELGGKRLTLRYLPASTDDIDTIEAFGGVLQAPPFLIHMVPKLLVEGEEVASGVSVAMGTSQILRATFHEPTGVTDRVQHRIRAGSYSALAFDLQRVTDTQLEARIERLNVVRQTLGVDDVPFDDLQGEILQIHALSYFMQVEATNRTFANQFNVAFAKQPAEMLASYAPTFLFLFGSAVEVVNTGMSVDVRRYIQFVSSRTNQREDERSYILATGLLSSLAESAVFEQLQNGPAVSAVRLIFEASKLGIPIFAIDATNLDAILPKLELSAQLLADVENAVRAGKRVIIPQQEISFFDYLGAGYIVLDPDTGGGAYLITGGLAGALTAFANDFLSVFNDIFGWFSFLAFIAAVPFLLIGTGGALLTAVGVLLGVAAAISLGWYVYTRTGKISDAIGAGVLGLVAAAVLVGLGKAVLTGVAVGPLSAMITSVMMFMFGTTIIVTAIVALIAALAILLSDIFGVLFRKQRLLLAALRASPFVDLSTEHGRYLLYSSFTSIRPVGFEVAGQRVAPKIEALCIA